MFAYKIMKIEPPSFMLVFNLPNLNINWGMNKERILLEWKEIGVSEEKRKEPWLHKYK